MNKDPRTEAAMESAVLADGDRLTELRARLAVLDDLRSRALQISPHPSGFTSHDLLIAWSEIKRETLLDIGIAERRAQGGRIEP